MPGAAACIANMTGQVEGMRASARKAADNTITFIYNSAKNTYCPVDKGNLKASADNLVISDGEIYTRRISFGKGLSYAFWVHEIPGRRHNNPPTASWKYLQIPVEKFTPTFFIAIENAVKKAIKG